MQDKRARRLRAGTKPRWDAPGAKQGSRNPLNRLTGKTTCAGRQGIRIGYEFRKHLPTAQPLFPIASVVAGVLLLCPPGVVSFASAIYLIFVGLVGLNGIYHIVK